MKEICYLFSFFITLIPVTHAADAYSTRFKEVEQLIYKVVVTIMESNEACNIHLPLLLTPPTEYHGLPFPLSGASLPFLLSIPGHVTFSPVDITKFDDIQLVFWSCVASAGCRFVYDKWRTRFIN